MICIGIDPGTVLTGYGVIDIQDNSVRWIDSGTISAPRAERVDRRLECMYDRLAAVLERYRPPRVCVEEAFYSKNVHTTLTLGQVRGVVLLAARKCGAAVFSYSPREIKKAVAGNGNATKEQVAYMVNVLLSPPATGDSLDASDALATALCGFFRRRGETMLREKG